MQSEQVKDLNKALHQNLLLIQIVPRPQDANLLLIQIVGGEPRPQDASLLLIQIVGGEPRPQDASPLIAILLVIKVLAFTYD